MSEQAVGMADFLRWTFQDRLVGKPKCEHSFTQRWYCCDEDCVVREVEISMKLFGEKKPTVMCPACGGVMETHGYVEEEGMTPEQWIEKQKREK
jgi:hypothetical protein